MPTLAALPADLASSVDALRADLSAIFGTRLRSLVAYGARLFPPTLTARPVRRLPLNTLALVDALSLDDLQACAARADAWRGAEMAMPLLLSEHEFLRSLDVFPFEYGDIIARHIVVSGHDPFEGMSPPADDLRHACERQAKSHLIHLREGFLETGGRGADLADLVSASAVPFATLVAHVARLRGRDDSSVDALVRGIEDVAGVKRAAARDVLALVPGTRLGNDDGKRIYPDYLATVEALVTYLDAWKQPA